MSHSRKRKKSYLPLICSFLFSILITVVVLKVDVKPIGARETNIGLATVNEYVRDLFGVHMAWYDVTQVLGYIAIGVAGIFGIIGLVQLVQRKSLAKVDREIICLGILYVIVVALYVLFEIVIVNYRPIIMPGETMPEASFPSSHTMLICSVFGSAIVLWKNIFQEGSIIRTGLIVVSCVIIALTVFGRLYCGVHWFTDIIAGLAYSSTLVTAYETVAIK